jgi:hypothetical protein
VVAGQFHGQLGPKYPGLLQLSFRPGILVFCPAGSAAKFVVTLAASHLFFPFIVLKLYVVFRRGYIVVTCW